MGKTWLTTEEVAEEIGVHIQTVRRWCRMKTLPAQQIGGGSYRINREALENIPRVVQDKQLRQLLKAVEVADKQLEGLKSSQQRARTERANLTRKMEAAEAETEALHLKRFSTDELDAALAQKLSGAVAKCSQFREQAAALGCTWKEVPRPGMSAAEDLTLMGGSYSDQRRRIASWAGIAEEELAEIVRGGHSVGRGTIGGLGEQIIAAREARTEAGRELVAALTANAQAKLAEVDLEVQRHEDYIKRVTSGADPGANPLKDLKQLVKEGA